MVVQSNVMYNCHAFYIGNGRPTEGKKGVEAVQEPLRDRYRGNVSLVEGSDVTVTVMPDVVHVQYANSMEPEFTLPISTLSMCAAVRCVESINDPSNMKFIPVHSVVNESEPDSDHPAIFVTVMRRSRDLVDPLLCHQFICNSSRDALHLVNATQTAHTALRRGYTGSGALKFFMEQSTDFDRTLHISRASTSGRMSQISRASDVQVTTNNTQAKTYVTTSAADSEINRINRVSRVYSDTSFRDDINVRESNTYYVKAGENQIQAPRAQAHQSETILVKAASVKAPAPPPIMQQQTIIVDKPIIRQPKPAEIPPPKIVERPVYIEGPAPPKIKPQVIYVDKPIMKEMKWPEPPRPEVVERPVMIEPPPAPKQEAQKIIVDKPILRDWPRQPTPPPPIIEENLVYIDPPKWIQPEAQRIIVDKPILKDPGPPPLAPAPIIEERPVYIDAPEYPKQEPHKIVIEKPVFNAPKPAPPPPAPIIEEKRVYIDPPAYPKQEPLRIVVEKPVIQDPGPPPAAPEPIIIEKPVHIDFPKYQQQEPQRIIVEKPIMRDPGPPPPPPPPIIIEKIVYIDPPPWPKVEPQRIVVEKPVYRARPPPQVPKPIIIEKPVYIDPPPMPVMEQQRVVVEKPVLRTTYGMSETRRIPAAYNYQYRQPPNVRQSYVVRSDGRAPAGLRRYAWSEVGDERGKTQYNYGSDAGGYRVYGQPRDFREKQFMNERGFSRRINGEIYQTRGANSYVGTRVDDRRSSVSS